MPNTPAFLKQFENQSLLAIIQKIVRMIDGKAPRIDELGKHHIAKLADKADMNVPEQDILELIDTTSEKIGDKIAALLGKSDGDNLILKGAAMGLTAGVGVVLLPGHHEYFEVGRADTTRNKLITVGIYMAGGIAAALISRQLNKNNPSARLSDNF